MFGLHPIKNGGWNIQNCEQYKKNKKSRHNEKDPPLIIQIDIRYRDYCLFVTGTAVTALTVSRFRLLVALSLSPGVVTVMSGWGSPTWGESYKESAPQPVISIRFCCLERSDCVIELI